MSSRPKHSRGEYRRRLFKDYEFIFPDIEKTLESYEVQALDEPIRKKFLKDIDPEMFLPQYQRFCSHQPTILFTPEQLEEAKAERRDVMIYPLTQAEGTRRAYICKHENYPFVGLKDNDLKNKGTYPFLPCCFGEPQNKTKSLRYQYENPDEEFQGTERGKREVFTSHK